MSDEGNRTERGMPPAPFGTEDTLAAPVSTPSQPPSMEPAGEATPPRWRPPEARAEAKDDVATSPLRDRASASLSLPRIDRVRYQMLEEVGRGGLGRVSRARDLFLDRPIAMKELLDAAEPAQRRFVREALITARLQHPAIVPIYDAGMADAQGPFYTMKLVDGRTLAERLAAATTLDARLALLPSVIAVADAVAYAHSQHIIHRDLKPQNVLVGEFGETVLIDWGLAKDLDAHGAESTGAYHEAQSTTETMDGAVMGTPAFMAPEQATAGGDKVDERADVYALGAILYYLGAGVPPHGGKSVDEMLVRVVSGDIVPLAEREPRIPADLAAIVAKAMAHDPDRRYRTAKEVSDDLRAFQTGKLVGAKTYTRTERLRRWVEKNRRVVGVTAGALAILLVYGGWSVSRIYAERERAEQQAARATSAAAEAAEQRDAAIAQAMLVRARRYAATGHTGEELAVLRALARPEAGERSRALAVVEGGLIWKSHQRLAMALGNDVGLVMRSADGARFVATEPGRIAVWDAATGRELASHRLEATTNAARFNRVAAISPTGAFAVVAACTGTGTCGIVPSTDDTYALTPATRLELRVLATGKVLAAWDGASTAAEEQVRRRSLAFATDDSAIAIWRGDRVRVIDPDGAPLGDADATGCTGPIAVAPGGAIAIGCRDHVRLGDKRILSGPAPTQLQFVGKPADRVLAIGPRVRLWDVARGELRGEAELPEAAEPTSVRDQSDDVEWQYHRPGGGSAALPDDAIEHIVAPSLSIVPRTSLLAPPARAVEGGAILTLEGPDWQALVLDSDRVRYALVDQLVPAEPPERCLPRIGGERHALVVLDGGGRLLIDEQELPSGLAAAPAEGYRHPTTDELPVRQLRPLVAAESDTCLVWGEAVGARIRDAGAIGPGARVTPNADGGMVIVDALAPRVAYLAPDGTRTEVPVGDAPAASPDGRYVVSSNPDTHEVTIAPVGQRESRAYRGGRDPHWVAPGVVELATAHGAMLASIGHPPRAKEPDLVTDPRSPYGVRRDRDDLVVVTVADGAELVRHVVAAANVVAVRPLPDDSGALVLDTRVDGKPAREVVWRDKRRVTLAPTRQFRLGRLEVVEHHLISRTDDGVAVWDLATGRARALPAGAQDAVIANGELWAITGGRKPRAVRTRLGRGAGEATATREVRLSTIGLPLVRVTDRLALSPDGRHLTSGYAVTDALSAVATWDVETGALLWVGPPSVQVIGDWRVAGGRLTVPAFDVDDVLRDSGTRTNLRVCKTGYRAVPVSPPPPPDTYWAPDEACTGAN